MLSAAVVSFPTAQACPDASGTVYNPAASTTAVPGELPGGKAGGCASNTTVALASGLVSACEFSLTYGQGTHTYSGAVLQDSLAVPGASGASGAPLSIRLSTQLGAVQ